MFLGWTDAAERAKSVAAELANHETFKSHGRFIDRARAEVLGLTIEHLESDKAVEEAVVSVYHAASHTFAGTPALKIVENYNGKAFIKAQQVMVQQIQLAQPHQAPPQTM
jgi:L-lactate utilization protein LutB